MFLDGEVMEWVFLDGGVMECDEWGLESKVKLEKNLERNFYRMQ